METILLSELNQGQRGRILHVHGHKQLRRRFLDMGLVKDTPIEITGIAPLGDPINLQVRGYHLAIRKSEADLIEIQPEGLSASETAGSKTPPAAETLEFHSPAAIQESPYTFQRPTGKTAQNVVPAARNSATQARSMYTVLLAGNPNCGKSTLFNALTGSHQHVGNWPGKTVEKKEGWWKVGETIIQVVDLPGTYSLTPYSFEEIVARDAILACEADLVVVVVDAANLERNLYLVAQILEMGAQVVMALNMWDVALAEGIRVNWQSLSNHLNVPVIPTSLNKNRGLDELKFQIIHSLRGPEEEA